MTESAPLSGYRNSFATLSDSNRCKAIQCLGFIPCTISGYLRIDREINKGKSVKCLLCEGMKLARPSQGDKEQHASKKQEALLALEHMIKSVDLHNSRRPRVLAMFTLRRFALHFDDLEFLNLETSPLAQWCLKSLTSSNRELRIAAG
jgi:serine/threonine-protein kinase ATR